MSTTYYQLLSVVALASMNPTKRIIESDLLIKSGVLPFPNTSEAFEFLTKSLGMCRCEVALFHDEQNQTISFAISIAGFSKVAEVFEEANKIMDRAQGIIGVFV